MARTIKDTFQRLQNKAAFIPYFSLGYPDYDTCFHLLSEASAHYDVLELGIPFSDPIADGPVIANAYHSLIQTEFSFKKILDFTQRLSASIPSPIVFMMYFNQIQAMGYERFLKQIKDCGVQGLIIPDLLADSQPEFNELAQKLEVDTIFLATPLTQDERLKLILKETSGYLYYTQVVGITGERETLSDTLENNIRRIKQISSIPVCVGFGISTPDHAKTISQFADGIIIGSAIIKQLTQVKKGELKLDQVTHYLQTINEATRH